MQSNAQLNTPLIIKNIEFKNRMWLSPMCQYSSHEGHPTDWHLVHLGSRAVGGVGLVMMEATAVSPNGRITPNDSGIWADEHVASFKRITAFLKTQHTVPGIQLAHAGRKASCSAPWDGGTYLPETQGGWQTIAPSAVPFNPHDPSPHAMTASDMEQVINDFKSASRRALQAGFEVLELHMAHGYLMHEFLSPISNFRDDEYGGSLEHRMRFPLEVAQAVRSVWPEDLPLIVRISATDWLSGALEMDAQSVAELKPTPAWTVFDSVAFAQRLKAIRVDLIDCSSGGSLAQADIPLKPGYQVQFAARIREEAQIMTAAVGLITEPEHAQSIIEAGQADAVFIGRELLRNPYWPLDAAISLGMHVVKPIQYGRS